MRNFFSFLVLICGFGLAYSVCHLMFYSVAPAIIAQIQQGDYHGLLSLLVYGLVAWFGGVGIPVSIVLITLVFSGRIFIGFEKQKKLSN